VPVNEYEYFKRIQELINNDDVKSLKSINKIMKKITLDDVILAIDRCEKINEASKKNCKKIKLFNFCLSIYF
jgi:hypothetical protein